MAVSLLDSLKKEIGKKKRKSQAFAWLADLEREAGDLETALARVNGGLTLYPDDVPAMLVRSAILFQNEDFQGCIEECEKVLIADPFCLSAQKRMGDAYDKLGNENSRNNCYRRVHDMDPLDPFWKEEYDNVIDEVVTAGAAGAAGVVLSESDFAMPGDLDLSQSADETFDMATEGEAAPSAEEPAAEEASLFEKSVESAEAPSPFAVQEPAVEDQSAGEGSLFEKSVSDESSDSAQNPFGSVEEESAEDDPFAALAALLPSSDSGEEAVMDSLQASLDSAMAEMANDEPSAPEVFPTDEEAAAEVSGSDVNSAISDMFGFEDDLEPEEPAEPASPFAHLDLPTSLDDDTASAENNAKNVFAEPAEDKPQSVDSAFESIFGEDELPEEKPQEQAAPVEEDKPQSVDSAFESIFGEDELPEEKPQTEEVASVDSSDSLFEKSASDSIFEKSASESVFEEPAAETVEEGSLFEKSASESIFEKSADESAELELNELESGEPEQKVEESAPVEDKPLCVDSAFESIFGEDELPEEKPQVEQVAEEIPSAEEKPFALEGNGSFLDDEPAVEVAAEPEAKAEEPAEDKAFSVDSAFDSIFGDDDDLPEEKPQTEQVVEDAPATESLAEQVSQAETELEMPTAEPEKENDFATEMGGAFNSMFGEDDLDLPEAKPAEAAPSQEDTGAALEEASLQDVSVESDLDKSFDSLFGSDDDLDLPVENSSETAPAAEAAEVVAPAETGSLENAVDGAFKGLFADDEDDFPEEEKPANKGVDFLMSGDSDDDVSNGLINDPSAPLSQNDAAIDDSLNTRTLAEIYFEQGLYGKALDIYEDLARKAPENEEIMNRLMEIEKAYREKFGGNQNG